MTPEDFLRSISPGEKQPDHLGLDQFIQVRKIPFYIFLSRYLSLGYIRESRRYISSSVLLSIYRLN